MDCFEFQVPEDATLVGTTAQGDAARIYPGEYLVHLLRSKAPTVTPAILRFVGADAAGRDVYLPLSQAGDSTDMARLPGCVEALGV
jgi:hypothetical protein